MAFGMKMKVLIDGFEVQLKPLAKSDMEYVTSGFQSLVIHENTLGRLASVLEDEQEWWDKNRKDRESCTWGIWVKDSETPIGVTGLHRLDGYSGSCTSGIIILDRSWWGKGVATRAHLARTLYAADVLNRFSIRSQVRTTNAASYKALQKVGYMICGKEMATDFRKGKYVDTFNLVWYNPERIAVLFPKKVPPKLKPWLEKAEVALSVAREFVTFE